MDKIRFLRTGYFVELFFRRRLYMMFMIFADLVCCNLLRAFFALSWNTNN